MRYLYSTIFIKHSVAEFMASVMCDMWCVLFIYGDLLSLRKHLVIICSAKQQSMYVQCALCTVCNLFNTFGKQVTKETKEGKMNIKLLFTSGDGVRKLCQKCISSLTSTEKRLCAHIKTKNSKQFACYSSMIIRSICV